MIGRGQFASVHLAVLSLRDGTSRDVAVKVLQRNTDKKYQLSFFRECLVMSQFNHPNIISFIGVAAGSDTVGQCEVPIGLSLNVGHPIVACRD